MRQRSSILLPVRAAAASEARGESGSREDSAMIKNIVFDFSNSTFMDSSGIGMIMGRYRVIKEKKGFVGVKGVGPAIHRILEISGLYKLVEICR